MVPKTPQKVRAVNCTETETTTSSEKVVQIFVDESSPSAVFYMKQVSSVASMSIWDKTYRPSIRFGHR